MWMGARKMGPAMFPTCDIGEVEVKAALPKAALVFRDLRVTGQVEVR